MDYVTLVKFKHSHYRTLSRGFNIDGYDLQSPILVKPNLCTTKNGTGYTVTDIEAVKSIISLLLQKDENLSIRIIESDSQAKYIQDAFDFFGYTEYCKEMQEEGMDVATLDLSKSPLTKIEFEGEYFKDPMEVIERTTIPVLAFFGAKDTQADPIQGAQAYQTALERASNPRSRVELIPDADHNLVLSETGCLEERERRPRRKWTNYAPGYLDTLEEWLMELRR